MNKVELMHYRSYRLAGLGATDAYWAAKRHVNFMANLKKTIKAAKR